MDYEKAKTFLKSGMQKMNLACDDDIFTKLLVYAKLILKWNKLYNLTAAKNLTEIVIKHILDSLVVSPYLKDAKTVLDVGSGAGFPGIPLAILHKNIDFFLLDSQRKKITFLNQVIINLKCENAKTIYSRIEDFQNNIFFDTIATRATYTPKEMIAKTWHFLSPKGKIVMLQGKYSNKTNFTSNIEQKITFAPLTVPHLEGERHLVIIEKEQEII